MSIDPGVSGTHSNKPAGGSGAVTAVAIVNFVFGVLQLACGGCIALGGGLIAGLAGGMAGELSEQNPDVDPQAVEAIEAMGQVGGGLIVVLGIAYLLFGVLLLVAGFGVLKRQSWGRILTLVLGGVAAALAILGITSGEWVGTIANIGYAILVFIVLLNKQNAAEFR